jgi:hypothetical protein
MVEIEFRLWHELLGVIVVADSGDVFKDEAFLFKDEDAYLARMMKRG